MRPSRYLVLAVFPVLASCDEENLNPLGLDVGEQFTADLSAAYVRPIAGTTTGTAVAEIAVREPAIGTTQQAVTFEITVTGLSSVTAAHIHLGGPAIAAGPVLVTLFSNPQDTTITASKLVSGAFTESSIVGVSLDSLVRLMRSGNAYVDLHGRSSVVPVLRGPLVPTGESPPLDRFAVMSMTGAKERPTPVTTTATGSATFELVAGNALRYEVRVSGITGVRMAHIHTAVADSAGPIVVTLFNTQTPTGSLSGVLANGTFSTTNIQLPGVRFDSLLTLMRLGRTYVNVHTTANPDGEIRGQIEPVSTFP